MAAQNTLRRYSALHGRWWIVAWAIACLLLVWEANTGAQRLRDLTRESFVFVAPAEFDSSSITGYDLGKRFTIIPDRADELHWIMHAQSMEANESLRMRHADYDNAPQGRPVHWTAPFGWWLRAVGKVDAWLTSQPAPLAIESAALYANLVLGLCVLTALAWAFSRRFGQRAALGLLVAFAGLLPFHDLYAYGSGDHHAAASLMALAMVACLVVGMGDGSRFLWRWLIASGLAGGVGLWVSAVSLAPVIAAAHVGGASLLWLERKRWDLQRANGFARSWRSWTLAGVAMSIAGYLAEYAPSDFSFRLEVIHPLYALAWLGAGEGLCRIALRIAGARQLFAAWLTGCAVLSSLIPLLIIVFGTDVYRVSDPFLWALHDRYLTEFQSIGTYLAAQPSLLKTTVACLPFAILFVAAGLLSSIWRKRPDLARPLALAFFPALVVCGLALFQVRWWGQGFGLVAALAAAALWASGQTEGWRRRAVPAIVFATLVPGCLWTLGEVAKGPALLDKRAATRIAERGVAHYLRERAGDAPLTALASPDGTTALAFYGSIRGIGTFYWENSEGLERAAAMFGAASFEEARGLLTEAGVTHVVLLSWGGFEREYAALHHEFVPGAVHPSASFVMKLAAGGELPLWLRPVPFAMMNHPLLDGEWALIFEVAEPQDPRAAAVERFEFALHMGMLEAANFQATNLEGMDGFLPAQISLARFEVLARRFEGFEARVQRILQLLPSAEKQLSLEDRMRLAGVLAAARHGNVARAQFEQAMAGLGEASLRRLNPDTLQQALALSDRLQVAWPDPTLRTLAERLAAAYRAPFGPRR